MCEVRGRLRWQTQPTRSAESQPIAIFTGCSRAGTALAFRRDPSEVVMTRISERIEFISDYCDRWCERCAYTERCSLFACQAAIGMCGDVAAGIELAVGRPQPHTGKKRSVVQWLADFVPDKGDLKEIGRRESTRTARVDAHPL